MKKKLLILISLAFLGLLSACEMLTTDNEINSSDPESDRGSYVWLNNRMDEEEDAAEVDGQFGREFSADANDEGPDAVQLDPTLPGIK